MEEIINKIMEESKTQHEHDLIDTIINIYNGVYIDYDDYVKKMRKLNEEIYKNSLVVVLAPEVFNYIRSKRRCDI